MKKNALLLFVLFSAAFLCYFNRPSGAAEPLPVQYADKLQGADASLRIRAAIANLPESGGIVDDTGDSGEQKWTVNPFEGQPKDKLLILRLGSTNVALSRQITLGNNRYIIGNLGVSAKGQLPTGTIFTPVAGFSAKSVFKIDPVYADPGLTFALGAAILNVAVDMHNVPTLTWGGTVFEINSLTHQELYGLRAVNNNGTFMVFGTSQNAGAQWCEDLDVRDFYSAGTGTVRQTAPVMEVDALAHSTVRDGRLFSAKPPTAQPDPASIDLLLQGGSVGYNRFENLRITAAWTGVIIQNLPTRGGFNGNNPAGTPSKNEFLHSDQEGYHIGYDISGTPKAPASWILIDNPNLATPFGAHATAVIFGDYTEYSTLIESDFGSGNPPVILGAKALQNMLWVMSPEAVVDNSGGSNLIFGRRNQTGYLWINHGIQDRGTPFEKLGNPANGTLVYCPDCATTNPCSRRGTGAFAKRLNGTWMCN
jgi:hypothetical protein